MHKIIIAVGVLVAWELPALGQEAIADSLSRELDPITIVGNRASTIPGSGQYVHIRQLEKLNQSNVNQVLRVIPGVVVRDEEGFGLRPNIGLRGTAVNRSAKITLMEDGILMAPAPYADPSAYYFPTFARMQGVEVLKGSSQIKYGPYTIGGAVNLLSTSIPDSFKGFAQLSYGSFGTNQQRIWLGNSTARIDYVIEVNRLASKGFKSLDNGGDTGFDRRDILGKLRWHTDEQAALPQSVTLKVVHAGEEAHETYLGLTYDDYRANPVRRYAATQLDKLDLRHSHITLNHTISPAVGWSLSTTAYYTTTFRDWARANTIGGKSISAILNDPTATALPYQIMVGAADGNVDFQSAARTYFSKGIQTSTQYLFSTPSLVHRIQAGLRYHVDQADRYATRSAYAMTRGTMLLITAGTKGNQENQIRGASSLAGYVSYDLQYKKLKVIPGVRYEHIAFHFQNYGLTDSARTGVTLRAASNEVAVVLPGMGATFSFNEKAQLFGGIHQGFSPPGMPAISSVNGQAKAERSVNYELGYRVETSRLNWLLVGFRNDYSNILGSDNVSGGGAGTGDFFNAGRAIVQGIELGITGTWLLKRGTSAAWAVPFAIAYTYTDARFQETFNNGGGDWGSGTIYKGDFIPFITPQVLSVSAGIEHRTFDATLTGRYNGVTRTKPGQKDRVVPAAGVPFSAVDALAPFLILDFSANYRLSKQMTLFALVQNLTNNTAIVANLPQGYRPNLPLGINVGWRATL